MNIEHVDNLNLTLNCDEDSIVARVVAEVVAAFEAKLEAKGNEIMSLLDDLKAADVAEDAKIDALIQGYQALKQMVADLQAQVAAGALDQAAVQGLIDAANAKSAAIDAALGVTPPSDGGEVGGANPA